MPSNPGTPREGNGAQNLSMARQMRDVANNLVDVKNAIQELMRSNKEAIGEVADKIFSLHTMTSSELSTVNSGIEGLKAAIAEIPKTLSSDRRNSVSADSELEKAQIAGSLAFCRLTVALALLGKGYPLDCYSRPNHPEDMEIECAKIALGPDATPEDIQNFLNLRSTADRSGITTVARQSVALTERSGCSTSKNKTVRERILLQRRRIHDALVPKIVNAWMSNAPGFASYRFGIAVKDQPVEVMNAAKEACKKVDGNKPTYLDASRFGNGFHEACKELMRITSQIVSQALLELVGTVPSERLQIVRDSVKDIEIAHGYHNRAMHEFSETDGFLPQQLGFVIVKVGSKLGDLVLAGQTRIKRGIELGHYHQWLKECVEISRIVNVNSSQETRRMESNECFKPCDEMMVYGVPIRGSIPDYERRLMDYLLTGDTSYDLGSEFRIRRRLQPSNGGDELSPDVGDRSFGQSHVGETPPDRDLVIPESGPIEQSQINHLINP